jgi:hypothetical protein
MVLAITQMITKVISVYVHLVSMEHTANIINNLVNPTLVGIMVFIHFFFF